MGANNSHGNMRIRAGREIHVGSMTNGTSKAMASHVPASIIVRSRSPDARPEQYRLMRMRRARATARIVQARVLQIPDISVWRRGEGATLPEIRRLGAGRASKCRRA